MVHSRKRLLELGLDLLQELYAQASPPLDFRGFTARVECGEIVCPRDWFQQHYLGEDEQEEIKRVFRKQHRISKHEWGGIEMLLLDVGPTGVSPGEQSGGD